MAITSFFKRNWIHFAAIGIFLVINLAYFSKQLQGYGLKQSDIAEHKGISREIAVYREHHNGEEPLWSNGMFGGMPSMQTSTIYHGNWFSEVITGFIKIFPSPLGIVLLYMLCFYAAMCMMKVNRWVAILGAVAFAFVSYDIVILAVGHNSKGVAIAFMAPVIGAFFFAYRRSWIWGAILSAVFMGFEMAANHLQVTYYLGFLLLGMGLVELVRAITNKTYMPFLKATAGIGVGYVLALVVNYGNIKLTADYAQYTIRGKNDLSINADGTSNAANSTSGLKRDYVVEYSYGLDESFTLLSPYVKGGGSMPMQNSPFAEDIEANPDLTGAQLSTVMQSNFYWGNQSNSGPVYIGVILVFLALLGMVYIKDPIKYAMLAVTILTLMLSWGKNYMGLTNWFLDNVPGYDKFRAVTIILVIIELCVPVLAVLFLDKLIKEREQIKVNIKPFYITTGAFLVFLIGLRFAGLDTTYLSDAEMQVPTRQEQEKEWLKEIQAADPAQLAQNGIDINNTQQIQSIIKQKVDEQEQQRETTVAGLKIARQSIFNSSMNRSIGFAFLAAVCLFLLFKTSLPTAASMGALGLLIVIDLMGVSRNYLNNLDEGSGYKYWDAKLNTLYPNIAEEGDLAIRDAELKMNPGLKSALAAGRKEGERLADELDATSSEKRRIADAYEFSALNERTNYRVFDFSNPFNSARTSYFHKSLGGYHGAKLRSIQNLIEFHLSYTNNKVLDMMNVRYFLQPKNPQERNSPLIMRPNPTAMGNGWFVKDVKVASNPNDEIRALGSKYILKNEGDGKLLINRQTTKGGPVYGSEKLQYLIPGIADTIPFGLSNGVPKGLEVFIVMDRNGAVSTVPQQTLDADTAQSFVKLLSYKVVSEFNVTQEAIVSKDVAKDLSQRSYKGEGNVTMLSYAPNKIVYNVNASDKGLAVFSEVYYADGWTATIDGKPAAIHRVNYLLRGLEIGKGKHKVVFSYDLPKFHKYNTYSMIASLLILLAMIGYGVMEWRKKKATIATTTED
jgi:Bacterial membrane protein YfhO